MPQEQKDGGAFWWATDRETGAEKRTSKGDRYMSGAITINGVRHNAKLFFTPAARKKNPRQPDINILFGDGGHGGGAAMDGVRERMANIPAPQAAPATEPPVDSIPW